MYMRGGFGLSTACDVRYEDDGGDDGPDEDVDFHNWNTWYSDLKEPKDREKVVEALELVARALEGKMTPHESDKAIEISLYIPAEVTLADIRFELVDALLPLGVDVSKAMIGIENLLLRIEDKGGETETTRLDFVLPAEGYALDKHGELVERGAEPRAKEGTPEAERDAELERARDARQEDQIAELAQRATEREAASEVERLRAELESVNEARRLAEEAMQRAQEEAAELRAERPAYVPDFPPPPPPRRHRAPEPPRVEEQEELARAATSFEEELARSFGFETFVTLTPEHKPEAAPAKKTSTRKAPSKPAKATKATKKTAKAKPTKATKKPTSKRR